MTTNPTKLNALRSLIRRAQVPAAQVSANDPVEVIRLATWAAFLCVERELPTVQEKLRILLGHDLFLDEFGELCNREGEPSVIVPRISRHRVPPGTTRLSVFEALRVLLYTGNPPEGATFNLASLIYAAVGNQANDRVQRLSTIPVFEALDVILGGSEIDRLGELSLPVRGSAYLNGLDIRILPLIAFPTPSPLTGAAGYRRDAHLAAQRLFQAGGVDVSPGDSDKFDLANVVMEAFVVNKQDLRVDDLARLLRTIIGSVYMDSHGNLTNTDPVPATKLPPKLIIDRTDGDLQTMSIFGNECVYDAKTGRIQFLGTDDGGNAVKLQVQKFHGAVILKQATWWPTGHTYHTFIGTVSVLEGKDALGFEVKDDSNWFARIEGERGSINIPGCQVKMVLQGEGLTAADHDPQGILRLG